MQRIPRRSRHCRLHQHRHFEYIHLEKVCICHTALKKHKTITLGRRVWSVDWPVVRGADVPCSTLRRVWVKIIMNDMWMNDHGIDTATEYIHAHDIDISHNLPPMSSLDFHTLSRARSILGWKTLLITRILVSATCFGGASSTALDNVRFVDRVFVVLLC